MISGLWRGTSRRWVVALLAVGLTTGAETYFVEVNDSGFSPAMLTITTGDTVVWVNVDESGFLHTTTSTLSVLDPNYWDGWMLDEGDTFTRTFNNVGSFHYFDQLGLGAGIITVNPGVTMEIKLESPRRVGGQFLFAATGLTSGKTVLLLAATSLDAWQPVSTNMAVASSMTFTNAVEPGSRFFWVIQLP